MTGYTVRWPITPQFALTLKEHEMSNQTFLFVTSVTKDLSAPPNPEHLRYVPVSCAEHELPQAMKAVHKQHSAPVIGVVSKEMVIGMLQTIEIFEKGQ